MMIIFDLDLTSVLDLVKEKFVMGVAKLQFCILSMTSSIGG
jgi:hypothetical protein